VDNEALESQHPAGLGVVLGLALREAW
jgi:hypothetical protein